MSFQVLFNQPKLILLIILIFSSATQSQIADRKKEIIDRERNEISQPIREKKAEIIEEKRERPIQQPIRTEPRIQEPIKENPPVYEDEIYSEVPVEVVIEYIYLPVKLPEKVSILSQKQEGKINYENQEYFKALANFNNAIQQTPEDYELFYYRGLTELQIKMFEDAKEDFLYYMEYKFFDPNAYFQLGLAKFYLNEKADAKEDFLVAAQLGDKRAEIILKRFYNIKYF
jgi:tetratricopeptide (TPR) repeat protein